MPTVLIIDDEPAELEHLRGMLGSAYRVEMAAGEKAAREMIAERGELIRAVLLDWNLAGCDGVGMIRWIREQPRLENVEVVVQSTEFVPEYIRAGLDCGAYYYLTKPFDAAQLEAIVQAAIETCELKRRLTRQAAETAGVVGLLRSASLSFRTREEAEALAVYLGAACSDPQQRVGLLELLLNAVEHGNLEISYEEKGAHLLAGDYDEEIERRLELPEYRDREVEVEIERSSEGLEVTITDCGPGFDFRRYFEMDGARLFDPNGRGVLLAKTALDLEYVEPGNRVRVRLPA